MIPAGTSPFGQISATRLFSCPAAAVAGSVRIMVTPSETRPKARRQRIFAMSSPSRIVGRAAPASYMELGPGAIRFASFAPPGDVAERTPLSHEHQDS
jgi:hypothetical protein